MSKKHRILLIISICITSVVSVLCFFFFKNNNEEIAQCIAQESEYILGGEAVGIKLLSSGVLVMGVDRLDTDIEVGDIILEVNNSKIETDSELEIYAQKGEELLLTIKHGDNITQKRIIPQYSNNSRTYKLGLWVKDSSAGVGTITFYDKNTLNYAALGHAIYEGKEGNALDISTGCITKTEIFNIKKGLSKYPGELKGTITNEVLGQIYKNTKNGIFGRIENDSLIDYSKVIKVANKEDIEEGEAYICVTLDDNTKRNYKINIDKVFLNSTDNKNMAISVIDEELIEKTGGIVQGMSGAPIVQNDRLIGSITHVLLDNPKMGYASFIENLISDMNDL